MNSEYLSETSRYRKFTQKHCEGCGVDIASNGDPVVPWAMNYELPEAEFAIYNSGHKPLGPIQLSGDARKLPFNNDSLDFVYSSHLLEDYADWEPVLREWVRPLKPGGRLIVILPDKERWAAAMKRGQPPNDAHRHEGRAGELSTYAERLGLRVIEDRLTDLTPEDYSILFVAIKQ